MRAIFFVIVGFLAGVAPAQESLGVRLVGCCNAVVDPCGVVVQGDYAYVADGASGFRVISISDPAHPVQVGHCSTPGVTQQGVAVSGDYAYVADFDQGLRVISIADPANPHEVGYCDTPDRAFDVALSGDYAYVADFDSGLRVISVADPANPVEVGHYYARVRGVAVSGDYAYVANYSDGLRVISIADPADPTEIGYCQIPDCAWAVTVESGYAYVAASARGLRVVSVADPAHPVEVGYCDTPGGAWSVAISGDSAYVADQAGGLRVMSVADSAHPVEVGYYVRDAGSAHGVAVRGGYVYVGDGGLRIYQSYVPGVEEEAEARVRATTCPPSIVHGALVLGAVDSRQNTGYRAELLDISGRKMLALKPGANDVRALAPGVYFVHEAQAQAQAVTKVIISE